jgi:hypothetical protein
MLDIMRLRWGVVGRRMDGKSLNVCGERLFNTYSRIL